MRSCKRPTFIKKQSSLATSPLVARELFFALRTNYYQAIKANKTSIFESSYPPQKRGANKFSGFSLIELITVVAGIAILTSLSIPGLVKLFASFENDEVKAHLNALAADCLSVSANMVDSEELMPAPTSVDTNLLNKNGYVEKSGNSCMYFQINPKNSSSKTHFSMGFGIANNKVTKFAIKDSANSNDITTECKQWAGEANCLNSGNDIQIFQTYGQCPNSSS